MKDWIWLGITTVSVLISTFMFGARWGGDDWAQAARTWERLYWDADDEARGYKMKLWECVSVQPHCEPVVDGYKLCKE